MSDTGNQKSRLSRWTLTTGVWVLAGLLIITAALLFSARPETLIFPSVTNIQPSGYAAFAELLRRDGYEVVIKRDVLMEFKADDVVVSTSFGNYQNDYDPDAFFAEEFAEFEQIADEDIDYWESLENYQKALKKHLESGGTVINIFSRIHFKQAEDNISEVNEDLVVEVNNVVSSINPNVSYAVTVPNGLEYHPALPYENAYYAGWLINKEAFVSYTAIEDGLLVSVGDGLGLSNRYLDQDDNAEFFLNLVREAAPAGSRIVIIEAGIGNAIVPTVMNTLGSWAVAARWQVILLFVVLVFTLARRFGLPEVDFRSQRGARELFDAIADVFRRSNNTGLALDSLLIEVDERIRSVIQVPSTISRSNMLQRVPNDLKEQYLNISELAVSKCSPSVASSGAKKLIELLEAFENDSRTARRLKR